MRRSMGALIAMALRQQGAHRIGNRAPIASLHLAKLANNFEKRRIVQNFEIAYLETSQLPDTGSGSKPGTGAMDAQRRPIEMRRDPARDFRGAYEARVNDGAITKMHRDGVVPPTDPDQLPVDRTVLSERSINKRLRAVATREGNDYASGFVAQRAGCVVPAEHFV